MKWRNLQHFIGTLSPEQLDQEVTVYMPFYQREFRGTVLTTRAAAKENDLKNRDSPIVLVVDTAVPSNER